MANIVPPELTEAQRAAYNQQVMADRTRTIDQIKRLYAVVMGFALTTCFANMYQCAKIIDIFSSYSIILVAQGVAFVTLILLFYLGAERLFDNRYLRVESRVPRRSGLLIDLFTSGATAVWFVILADTFPDAMKYNNQESMEAALAHNISFFAVNLLLLYIVDSFFLIIQIWRTYRQRTGDFNLMIRHHWFWFILNLLGVILLYPVIINFPNHSVANSLSILIPQWVVPVFNNYLYLSVYILTLHMVRFIADYWYAFRSYYPPDERTN